MTTIGEILRGRTDLSAFLVHLTKGDDAEGNLKSMLTTGRIEARHPHGWNRTTLQTADARAVCFTETPLEYLAMLCGEIEGRNVHLSEWGLAFGKYQARLLGANPILYAHGYPNQGGGLYQPANALDALRDALDAHIAGHRAMTPRMAAACETLLSFSSKMRRVGGANEWWWEREWRRVGDFAFGTHQVAFGLCPRDRVTDMEAWARAELDRPVRFLSASWTVEEVIGHLADLPEDEPPWPHARY